MGAHLHEARIRILPQYERQNALVVLVRHGESRQIASGTMVGGITRAGVNQARATAKTLKEHLAVSQIISSPLQRTRETAQVMRKELTDRKLKVEFDERLRERGTGKLNKATLTYYWRLIEDKDVEPFQNVAARMNDFMLEMQRGVIVAVTHGDCVRAPLLEALGFDETSGWGIRIHNANMSFFHVSNGEITPLGFGLPIITKQMLEKIPAEFKNAIRSVK